MTAEKRDRKIKKLANSWHENTSEPIEKCLRMAESRIDRVIYVATDEKDAINYAESYDPEEIEAYVKNNPGTILRKKDFF